MTNDFRTYEKKILRGLLAEDKLEKLQEQLQDIMTADEHKDLSTEVFLNSGRLSHYRKTLTIGTASNDELTILRNQIRFAFLNIIDALPNEIIVSEDPSFKPKRLMTEQRFKSLFLSLVSLVKALIVLFILTFGASGISKTQISPIVFSQIPMLIICLTIFLSDFIYRRNDIIPRGNDRKVVNRNLRNLSYLLLPIYFFCVIGFIDNYSSNEEDTQFYSFLTWLLIIESGFGVFLGQIVYGLFREK